MARKQEASQPRLFQREIPKMPEGYYSSGPNPNLRAFVEAHATPYDPQTDDYRVPPFDKPITTTKATAIYNMHTYWSKKPHDAIREYIRHYTQPGDLVLDPFCGSGGTALAALMEGRAAIAIDLSPAATFITKNYCTPVDVDELQRAFEELERKVKPELDWLYETRCDRCGGRATTSYTVYSYVFQCPRCLEKVPLFDCPEAQAQTAKGKPKTIRVCPHCQARGHQEEISTRSRRFGEIPVMVSYECQEGCRPKHGERRHNDSDPKKQAYFRRYDLGKLSEIEVRPVPYWTPKTPMIKGYETTVKRNLERQGVRLVDDLFTKRNLWALAAVFSYVGQVLQQRDVLNFGLTALLLGLTKMNRYRPDVSYPTSIISGTYYLPQISVEAQVWHHYANKINRLAKGYQAIAETGIPLDANLMISTQSALDLQAVSTESIDYIFTDPPYGGNVQYGELNFVWEAWLGYDSRWHSEEVIVNSVRHRTESDWAAMMRQAMVESCRVLKPGRWVSLCYHDTSEGTWQLVQDTAAEVGLISEKLDRALFIDTGGSTYNQNIADKVTKRDLVINFRKPRPGELSGQLGFFDASDFTTFQEAARAVLVDALTAHPGSTADRLYDELVSRLVRQGQFERHDFDALLRSVAEPVSESRMKTLFEPEPPNLFGTHEVVRWYLNATSDVQDEAETAKEEAAAARLEAFMVEKIKIEHGEGEGVHYSDLFEQYLPVKDKPRRLLQEWLPEFFFKTQEGTWRPSEDDEERAQLASLRASGLLRRVKRFARALIEGVPPHDRDRPENAATAADWLRQCRRAGLYEYGRALYEHGGFDFSGLSEVAQVEAEEDYQVCVRRSG